MTQPAVYRLPDPAYEQYTWLLQDEHAPAAQAPLTQGGNFAMAAPPPPGQPPNAVNVNGYNYMRAGANPS